MPDLRLAAILAALSLARCTPSPAESHPGSAASAKPAATAPAVSVELVQSSGPVSLDARATHALVERVEKGLAVCNFTSEAKAEIFGGEDLDALWKTRQQGPHLSLRYPSAKTIDAVAGKLVMTEVMLSIGQPNGPEPALMKGEHGVVGLKKCGYDDRFLGCAPELAAVFPKPEACPPGM